MQPAELAAKLKSTVGDAAIVIRKLPAERLGERKVIQKMYEQTLMEAIYHVVEHFAQHTGQIMFATKLLTGAGPRLLQAPQPEGGSAIEFSLRRTPESFRRRDSFIRKSSFCAAAA